MHNGAFVWRVRRVSSCVPVWVGCRLSLDRPRGCGSPSRCPCHIHGRALVGVPPSLVLLCRRPVFVFGEEGVINQVCEALCRSGVLGRLGLNLCQDVACLLPLMLGHPRRKGAEFREGLSVYPLLGPRGLKPPLLRQAATRPGESSRPGGPLPSTSPDVFLLTTRPWIP